MGRRAETVRPVCYVGAQGGRWLARDEPHGGDRSVTLLPGTPALLAAELDTARRSISLRCRTSPPRQAFEPMETKTGGRFTSADAAGNVIGGQPRDGVSATATDVPDHAVYLGATSAAYVPLHTD
jgi:hypothetical protein